MDPCGVGKYDIVFPRTITWSHLSTVKVSLKVSKSCASCLRKARTMILWRTMRIGSRPCAICSCLEGVRTREGLCSLPHTFLPERVYVAHMCPQLLPPQRTHACARIWHEVIRERCVRNLKAVRKQQDQSASSQSSVLGVVKRCLEIFQCHA